LAGRLADLVEYRKASTFVTYVAEHSSGLDVCKTKVSDELSEVVPVFRTGG